jgi:hypothetical protein
VEKEPSALVVAATQVATGLVQLLLSILDRSIHPSIDAALGKHPGAGTAPCKTIRKSSMTLVASRYRFRESAEGFSVEGDERPPVDVVFRPVGLEAWYVGETLPGSRERFGFFNFGKLLEFVARGLMRDWQPQEGWYGARAWAQQQTARAIARRLREQWLRLVARADPVVCAVQKAIFAVTFSDAPLASEPALYQDRYLVQDVLRYPAAAIAVRNAWTLTRELPLARLHSSAPAQELRKLAQSLGVTLHLGAAMPDELSMPAQLERLKDWKALFSDTGHAYRSLNRTLMNLPGRVPHRLVCNLRRVHLERPMGGSRLELLAVVLHAGICADRADRSGAEHEHLFQHARATQIKEAMRRVALHLRQPLDPRKASDVRQVVQFLADYPCEHNGNLVGLAERAIRWHRDQQREQMTAMRRHYGAETPTQVPPIPLPDAPGVIFLDSVGSICNEAERMQHCVASYIDLAAGGNCYLFRISYKGEEATVEVGCEGKVRQAQGPRNQRNKAARWGKRLLNRWAAKLPAMTDAPRRCVGEEDIPF